jgi:ATP-dependent exoDNAse (exonuclease V) alpha subunit
VDCVIIDEAGQLSLGLAALVLRSLLPEGRVLISGDHEQLAPILTAQYPRLKSRLFGSILDCLMDLSGPSQDEADNTRPLPRSSSPTEFSETASSQISTIVQLTENFRSVLQFVHGS